MADQVGVQEQYTIEPNSDLSGVRIEFVNMSIEGISQFIACMPPEVAIEFAEQVKDCAEWMLSERDSE